MPADTRETRAAFPILIPLYLVLFITLFGATEASLGSVLIAAAVVTVAAAVGYGAVCLALERRLGLNKTALIASLLLFWVSCVPTLGEEARELLRPYASVRLRYVFVGSLAAVAMLAWVLARTRRQTRTAVGLTRIWVYILLSYSVARLAGEVVRQSRLVDTSPGVRWLMRPLEGTNLGRPGSPPPLARDVYLIVLDEYANSRILTKRFGFDNAAFEDSLRALGFTIPGHVRANYGDTVHALAAMLGMEYLDTLQPELGKRQRNEFALRHLIRHNRTFRFLEGQGYRTYFVPSVAFWPTQSITVADSTLWPSDVSLPDRHFVLEQVWNLSVPGYVARALGLNLFGEAATRANLAALRGAVALPGPKLVFAHVMLTHLPFYLDARCQPKKFVLLSRVQYSKAYLEEVACTNQVILDVVTRALRRSGVPPIILLQADHGTGTLIREDSRFTASRITGPEADERFGAFGAYYLPGPSGPRLGDEVTPVSVMREVFASYLHADLERLPDRSYVVPFRQPFSFVRIADSVLHSVHSD